MSGSKASNRSGVSSSRKADQWRMCQAFLAAVAATTVVRSAFAGSNGTFTTSTSAPVTNVLLSQPDDTGSGAGGANLTGYIDYTNNNNGVGEAFIPTQNMTLDSITFQGGGSAGGSLAGNWGFVLGTIQAGQNWWGTPDYTVLDTEVGDGTPIANDVANGVTTNYDTYTLGTPQKLTAGQLYYWNFDTTAVGGYYGLAISGSTPFQASLGETGALSVLGPGNTTSVGWQRSYDRTFYLTGTVATTSSAQWAKNGNGAWETDANWSTGAAPGVAGDTATFGSDGGTITVSPVVTLSTAVTINSMTFSSPTGAAGAGYNISNGGSALIYCDTITALSGTHSINVPLNTTAGTAITVDAGATLTASNLIDGVGYYHAVTITGGGTFNVNSLNNAAFTLNDGTTLTSIAGGSTNYAWPTVNGGATWNINSPVVVEQMYADYTTFINIGPAGSLTTEQKYDQIDSTLSGSGSLSFGGGTSNAPANPNGELTSNNSNFSGPILVTNGWTLALGSQYYASNDNQLGNAGATNIVTLDNGTISLNAAISGSHQFNINAGGGTFNTAGFSMGIGSVSGAGVLNIAGGGAVTVAPQVVAANSSGGIRSLPLGGLNLASNSNISFGSSTKAANRTVLVTGGLSLSGSTSSWTSTVDLGNNDMIIQNGNLTTITNQIQQGYANATWQGSGGILSTAAAADTSHLTALGVIQNSVDGTTGGLVLHSTFDGVSSSSTDVLVKYTYYGDATLDGKVDGTDYSRIDNGYLTHATGWYDGDFNYDGVINGSDYTLIDNSYNTQGAQFSGEVAAVTAQIASATVSGSSAVPEPASLGLLGIGVVGLLSRRKNRRHF